MTRVVTLGETMALARTTEIGSLRHASGLALGIGGAESNVAVGLQRLGIDASWLGRVGDDPLGERIARELRGEGLDVRALVDTGAPTGLMIKERPSAASTAVHYYRRGSAGSRLSAADVPDGWIEAAALLHVTGITPLLSDTARSAVLAVVERARAAGVPVSFDINYRSALAAPEVAAPVLREIAERATLVFGGVEELELLGPDATASLLAAGVGQVIVKRGPEGAVVFTTDDATEALGFVIEPLDTVGAGDAFVAGFLSAWLEGLSAADALVRGNACGAMACLVPGDWEAAPTRRDLERFLAGGGDPVRR
ncbi:sugar kinase, ribokinase family [Microbacterium testaceum StLB037]|uniref:Sugar kinase, ribokinase family n=1 Tax=Microbacterium testaceum (strain StLB037) TaxID=979556 RepID=E8N6K3_MICTS|nr:sugar kinase [Microbacterium testaceum]BAJ74151.1 sugar kinase, ribokinase family [Microbacterium testaceum StLB037]